MFLLTTNFALALPNRCNNPITGEQYRFNHPEECLDPLNVAPLPGDRVNDVVVTSDIISLLGQVARFLIISSTIVAVIFIVWGGIMWMSSGSDTEKQKKAKALIQNGIIGALIVLAIGVIMQTIYHFVTTQRITQ